MTDAGMLADGQWQFRPSPDDVLSEGEAEEERDV
jgi:hypothetical protein